MSADAWLKKKVFFINPYVIEAQKLPVAGPKNMSVDFASLKLSKKQHISINIKVFEICFQF